MMTMRYAKPLGAIALVTGVTVCVLLVQHLRAQQIPLWHDITLDEAMQLIREFENDPNLSLTLKDPPAESNVWQYVILSPEKEYRVPLESRPRIEWRKRVWTWQTYSNTMDPETQVALEMSLEDLRQIARSYMQAHYPQPQRLNKEMYFYERFGETTADGRSIEVRYEVTFIFREQLPSGANTAANCWVTVNTVYGQVDGYSHYAPPIFDDGVPSLTPQQALQRVQNVPGFVEVVPGEVMELRLQGPDDFGSHELIYLVKFYARREGSPFLHPFFTSVNARTGEVNLPPVPILGEPHQQKEPKPTVVKHRVPATSTAPRLRLYLNGREVGILRTPLLIENKPYLYVAVLQYGKRKTRVEYSPDEVRLLSEGRVLVFRRGKAVYTDNGKPFRMSSPARWVNGRCYVPIDVVQRVTGLRVRYDALGRRIVITKTVAR